jgi:hypothetical protein
MAMRALGPIPIVITSSTITGSTITVLPTSSAITHQRTAKAQKHRLFLALRVGAVGTRSASNPTRECLPRALVPSAQLPAVILRGISLVVLGNQKQLKCYRLQAPIYVQ